MLLVLSALVLLFFVPPAVLVARALGSILSGSREAQKSVRPSSSSFSSETVYILPETK